MSNKLSKKSRKLIEQFADSKFHSLEVWEHESQKDLFNMLQELGLNKKLQELKDCLK